MALKKPPSTAMQLLPALQPTFRSGAVARMAGMPVSTLRIWEQRYRAVGPSNAPSGHRQYSAADVQRVLLLRQLTEQGHAIGSIAALDAAQLQQVASTHGASHAGRGHQASPAGQAVQPAWQMAAPRLIVVGQALALRLQRPAVVQRLGQPWPVVAVFESLAEAAQAAQGASVADGVAADLLLWQAPGLLTSALPGLKAAQVAWGAGQVAVSYRFAGAAATRAFGATGARVIREPADDDALGAWLASLPGAWVSGAQAPARPPVPPDAPGLAAGDITPRRFDDTALTVIAGLSSTIACECPRHVAELLMQLSNFEAYSADCAHRSPADAELHAYLQRVAGASRGLFEAALERVARHEGLLLP